MNKSYVDGLAARFFDPAFNAGCNANTVCLEHMLRNARRYHPDKNLESDFGVEWHVLCKEISQLLNGKYNTLKTL